MTSLLVISCPASAALEDSYTTVDKDARKSDLHSLVLTLRRLETAHALSKELAEAVDHMDSDADLLGTRARLLSFLPDISRQTFIRERRNSLQPIRPAKEAPTTSSTTNSFSQILWLDPNTTYKPETELWLQTWNDSSEQDGVSGFNDFTADSRGLSIGLDRELTDKWLLGLSVGTDDSEIDSKAFGKDDIDTNRVGVGLSYASGRHSVSFSWQRDQAETDRVRILLLPTAKGIKRIRLLSEFDNTRDSSSIGYSTFFEPTHSSSISPFIRAAYGRVRTDDYNERGDSSLGLAVATDDQTQLLGTLGVTFSWFHFSESWSFAPSITVAMEYDFRSDFTTTLSRFTDTSDTFRTRGYELTETRWRASAAMTAFYRNRAYISLSYEADDKDDYHHDGVILALTVRVD